MDEFDSILENMKEGHSWNQEEIDTYMKNYSRKDENYSEIRNYEFGEENKINQLFSGIDYGRHNVSNLEKDDNIILVKYNEGINDIVAAAAYKGDKTQRFISVVAVDENHRRKGHGKSLIKKISSETEQVTCNVHRDNSASIGMLESNGFKAVSRCGDYIGMIRETYF